MNAGGGQGGTECEGASRQAGPTAPRSPAHSPPAQNFPERSLQCGLSLPPTLRVCCWGCCCDGRSSILIVRARATPGGGQRAASGKESGPLITLGPGATLGAVDCPPLDVCTGGRLVSLASGTVVWFPGPRRAQAQEQGRCTRCVCGCPVWALHQHRCSLTAAPAASSRGRDRGGSCTPQLQT